MTLTYNANLAKKDHADAKNQAQRLFLHKKMTSVFSYSPFWKWSKSKLEQSAIFVKGSIDMYDRRAA